MDKRQATATLIEASDRAVRVRRTDGKIVTVPLAGLEEKDRQYVATALSAPKLSIEAIPRAVASAVRKVDVTADAKLNALRSVLNAQRAQTNRPIPANVVYVRVSEPFLRRYIRETIDRPTQISEMILGTSISGTGRCLGRTTIHLIPSDDRAVAELRLSGTIHANTVGYNGPAIIYSASTTPFTASTRISLSETIVAATPSISAAQTRSVTTGIGSTVRGLRGLIVRRVASRRVAESRAQGDAIAAVRAAAKINREFDSAVAKRLEGLTDGIASQVAKFTMARADQPISLVYSTTEDYLQLVAVRGDGKGNANEAQPLRVAAPERSPGRPEVEVHVHSSLVGEAMSELQWRGVLQPVVEVALAQGVISGGGPSKGGPANWRVQYSEGNEWVTLRWDLKSAGPQAIAGR